MIIEVKSQEEFERLLNALCNEAVEASIHFRLYSDLNNSHKEYGQVFNETWTFWSLTFQAHWDTTLFRLCKIYDQHKTSLNLRNLLDTIKANVGIFDVENFRERLKGNAFVDSLAADARRPDVAELKKDVETVTDNNADVKALLFWRNNFYAHRSAEHVAEKKALTDRYVLSYEMVERLLKNAMRIVNAYSSLFRASTYLTQIVGHDDYQYVLRTINDALKEHEAKIERETAMIEEMMRAHRSD
jgi:hypothetical protein